MNQEIEQQLKQQPLHQPSKQLDRRMDDLFAADLSSIPTPLSSSRAQSRWTFTLIPTPVLALAAALLIALPAISWFTNTMTTPVTTPTTPTTPSTSSPNQTADLTIGPVPSPLDRMIRFDHTITQTRPGRPMLAQSPDPIPATPNNLTTQSTPLNDPATRSLPFPNLPTVVRPMLDQTVNYTRWHDPETGVTIEHARPQQNVRYIALPVY